MIWFKGAWSFNPAHLKSQCYICFFLRVDVFTNIFKKQQSKFGAVFYLFFAVNWNRTLVNWLSEANEIQRQEIEVGREETVNKANKLTSVKQKKQKQNKETQRTWEGKQVDIWRTRDQGTGETCRQTDNEWGENGLK